MDALRRWGYDKGSASWALALKVCATTAQLTTATLTKKPLNGVAAYSLKVQAMSFLTGSMEACRQMCQSWEGYILQATRVGLTITLSEVWAGEPKACPHSNSSSNKATPTNRATLFGGHFLSTTKCINLLASVVHLMANCPHLLKYVNPGYDLYA